MSKKYLTDEEELGYFNSEKFKQDVKNIRNKKMDKYYTPELEDLFIGYEIKRYIAGSGDSYENIILNKIELEWCLNCYNTNCQKGWLRTPYLTKEQIESEGWVYIKAFNSFNKNEYNVRLLDNNQLRVSAGEFSTLIFNCPSINEFRKIIKLLEI